MTFTLGINTNFAINRIVEPEELVRVVGDEIGLRRIQLTPEILSPDWPAPVIARHVKEYDRACAAHGVAITHTFTGAYSRLNHLAHPDAEVRRHWVAWFKRLVEITADLGAESTGSQIGVLTYRDDRDPERREARINQAFDGWRAIADHAEERGLGYLMWEPMSIRREFGETIRSCREMTDRINAAGMAVPIKINVDIDHGDVTSDDPDDYDPYAWARAFAADSPIVHIKQSSMDKGGHRPFTPEYNAQGKIVPETLVAALREGGGTDNQLVFEFSFREREPTDSGAVEAMRRSVEYWRGHVEV